MAAGVGPSAIGPALKIIGHRTGTDVFSHVHESRYYRKKRPQTLPLNRAITSILAHLCECISVGRFDGKRLPSNKCEVNTCELTLKMPDGGYFNVSTGCIPVRTGTADAISDSVTEEFILMADYMARLHAMIAALGHDPLDATNWFPKHIVEAGFEAPLPDYFLIGKVKVWGRDDCATARKAGENLVVSTNTAKQSSGTSGTAVEEPCFNHKVIHMTEHAAHRSFAYSIAQFQSDTGRPPTGDEKSQMNLAVLYRQVSCYMGAGNPYYLNQFELGYRPFAENFFGEEPTMPMFSQHGGRFYDLFVSAIPMALEWGKYEKYTDILNKIPKNLLEGRVYAQLRNLTQKLENRGRAVFADKVIIPIRYALCAKEPRGVLRFEFLNWIAHVDRVLTRVIKDQQFRRAFSLNLLKGRDISHFNDSTSQHDSLRLNKKILKLNPPPTAQKFVLYSHLLRNEIYECSKSGSSQDSDIVTEFVRVNAEGFQEKMRQNCHDYMPNGKYSKEGLPEALNDDSVTFNNDFAERSLGVATDLQERVAPLLSMTSTQGMTGLRVNKFLQSIPGSDYPTRMVVPQGFFAHGLTPLLQRVIIDLVGDASILQAAEERARECMQRQVEAAIQRDQDAVTASNKARKAMFLKEALATRLFEGKICKSVDELEEQEKKHSTSNKIHVFHQEQLKLFKHVMKLDEAKVPFTKTVDKKVIKLPLRGAVETCILLSQALNWTPKGVTSPALEGQSVSIFLSQLSFSYVNIRTGKNLQDIQFQMNWFKGVD